jgi:hypothetical protein
MASGSHERKRLRRWRERCEWRQEWRGWRRHGRRRRLRRRVVCDAYVKQHGEVVQRLHGRVPIARQLAVEERKRVLLARERREDVVKPELERLLDYPKAVQ